MTHWRQQHEHGIAELRRVDERFDRMLRLLLIGLAAILILLWGYVLS